MCLELIGDYQKKQFIASEDIEVYKVVTYTDKPQEFITPYQHMVVKLGCTYESEFSFNCDGDVEKGLHSFCNQARAQLNSQGCLGRLVVKCLIPKGSRYYIGWYGTAVSYASDKLTYVEIL